MRNILPTSSLRQLVPGLYWSIYVNSRVGLRHNDLAWSFVRPIKAALQRAFLLPRSIVSWPQSPHSMSTSSSQICFLAEKIRSRKSMTLLSHGSLNAIALSWGVLLSSAPFAELSVYKRFMGYL